MEVHTKCLDVFRVGKTNETVLLSQLKFIYMVYMKDESISRLHSYGNKGMSTRGWKVLKTYVYHHLLEPPLCKEITEKRYFCVTAYERNKPK